MRAAGQRAERGNKWRTLQYGIDLLLLSAPAISLHHTREGLSTNPSQATSLSRDILAERRPAGRASLRPLKLGA